MSTNHSYAPHPYPGTDTDDTLTKPTRPPGGLSFSHSQVEGKPNFPSTSFGAGAWNPGENLSNICIKYEIAGYMEEDMFGITGYGVILICDDSSSMNAPTEYGTRWDELKNVAGIVVDIGGALDEDGIDIYFLNRSQRPYSGIRCADEVVELFKQKPCGRTPLTRTLANVIAVRTGSQNSSSLLRMVFQLTMKGMRIR